MKRKTAKNRWLIALAAVGIHICIGSVYAWSVYTGPLTEDLNWALQDVQLTFSIAIFFLGISAAFLGKFIERIGPRKAGILAGILFGLGTIGSGFAVQVGSVYLLYIFYGMLGGIGLGIGYIAPVATLLRWFPDKRGLAAGLAIMGFGFAALLSSPVIVYIIESLGIAKAFYITGSVYFIMILLSSLYLFPPPANWVPANFHNGFAAGKKTVNNVVMEYSAEQALRSRKFWYLWVMFFINISCGISVISVASPLAQEYANMSVVAAAAIVGVMGLFNGAGRIGWASLSDLTGRPAMFSIFFLLQIIAFLLLPSATNPLLFQILIFIIISCYGGGFATMPAFLGDLFGTRNLGVILGYMLTAWAAAGLAGPVIAAKVRDLTGSYNSTLYLFAAFLGIALILSILMYMEVKKLNSAEKELYTSRN